MSDGGRFERGPVAAVAGIVPMVVQQHVEDAAILHATRTELTRAPHAKLHHLRRFDDRLAAHLDGLAIAGAQALPWCEAALEPPTAGAMFVATVRALELKNEAWLQRLAALAESVGECRSGFASAWGWSEPEQLRGVVSKYLTAAQPEYRLLGMTASSLHRVDPGLVSARRFEDPHPAVRARALRVAGELGKYELVSTVAAAITDEDPACGFWAAWSAVLLGDRLNALDYLKSLALAQGPLQSRAFQLAMQAMPIADAHAMLQQIARDPVHVRRLIQGAGWCGDPSYVPWLIGQMADEVLARAAGEAFGMITGADLEALDLEGKTPENAASGPNDDPEDPDVDRDPDESLPWPDQERVKAWWTQNAPRFSEGTRHFLGAPLTRGQCIDVLKTGYQRQRIAAAYHRCLLNPGTPLFEWRAPAWRQQRELAQLV